MTKKEKDRIRYYAYKTRKISKKIASDKEELGGHCARASALLSCFLSKAGIKHKIVYGHYHVYIESDGYVVDVTATQFYNNNRFKYPATLIRPMKHMQGKDSYWDSSKRFRSVSDLIRWQKKGEWPKYQIASLEDLKYAE